MTKFKPNDLVRVVNDHLVLLDGDDESHGYSACELESVPAAVPEFKVGDRVKIISSGAFKGRIGTVKNVLSRGLVRVVINGTRGTVSKNYAKEDLSLPPTALPRGHHPNSLANLAGGQARREGCRTKKLRLTAAACEWLEQQPDQGRVVERLIMEEIKREEP